MDHDQLAQRFEEHRTHLRSVALRMLGSESEAEDAVQEAWLKLRRADVSGVENLGGWLTTVVVRVCLDALRSRGARREEPAGAPAPAAPAEASGPEDEALLADSIGPALLVVLDALAPAERLAFVLHDTFALPFDEIARIVGRSPEAARQLASRARRRVRGATVPSPVDLARQHEVVSAFLSASRGGDLDALLALLDPDAVVRADGAAVRAGASREIRGAAGVAETFKGRALAARAALLDGAPGAVWAHGGRTGGAFRFTVEDGRVREIEIVMDPEVLGRLEVSVLDG